MNLGELRNLSLSLDKAEIRDVFIGDNNNPEHKFKAVYNLDKNKVSAIVSDRYNLMLHSHIVNSVIDALSNLNIKTTARVGNSGDRIVIDLTFNDSKLYAEKGDEFFCGIRLINSYNKTTGIMILPHLVRLACSNGMTVNVGWVNEFNITHTQRLTQDFEQVIQLMIKDMVNSNDKFKAMINNCIGDSVEWEVMDRIISKLVERDKHIEPIKQKLREYCKNDIPTRWDLYNAFTDYATNGQQIKPSIELWLQNKAQKVLTTPLINLKGDEN